MPRFHSISCFLTSILLTLAPVSAGTPAAYPTPPPAAGGVSRFDQGRKELQSLSGAFFSFSGDDTLNYSLSCYRFGWMLTEVSREGFFRGNTELLVEGFFGTVLKGSGDYLGGATIQLRYNFVQPDARWIPYVQAGAGVFVSDIYKDRTQSLLAEEWACTVQASAGVRYLLTEKWALCLEGGFRHVCASGPDEGLSALGAQVGLCRAF